MCNLYFIVGLFFFHLDLRDYDYRKLENTSFMLKDSQLVKLHPFEVAALASLISADGAKTEEVIAWIPSLIRFDEDQIDIAIDVVTEAKRRIAVIQ